MNLDTATINDGFLTLHSDESLLISQLLFDMRELEMKSGFNNELVDEIAMNWRHLGRITKSHFHILKTLHRKYYHDRY